LNSEGKKKEGLVRLVGELSKKCGLLMRFAESVEKRGTGQLSLSGRREEEDGADNVT